METSINIAALTGPALMLISLTEFLNYKIWEKVEPTVVYLNGVLLFVAGLAILRSHNSWSADWTVIVTITGWVALLAGILRSFFPNAKQLARNTSTYVLLGVIFLLGMILTFNGYF